MRGAAVSLTLTIALGLIMAGALGNCYDRLLFGHVRDFVHFHVDSVGFDCAIFNFADNMLVIGAVILVLFALRSETSEESDAAVAVQSASLSGRRIRRAGPAGLTVASPGRPLRSATPAGAGIPLLLHVVVERELVGMWAGAEGVDLVGLLVPDPGVDDVRGEDIAAKQEVVVGAEGVE